MDGSRFDAIARLLSGSGTRRGVLAALAAVGLAPAAADAADKKGNGKNQDKGKDNDKGKGNGDVDAQGPCGDGTVKANRCTKDKDCCTGYCDPTKDRCRCKKVNQACTSNRQCCTARNGLTCQQGRCKGQAADCGGAGPCGAGEVCCNDVCVAGVCCTGSACGGDCVDTQTDPVNCGSCGTVCSASTPICSGGLCVASP